MRYARSAAVLMWMRGLLLICSYVAAAMLQDEPVADKPPARAIQKLSDCCFGDLDFGCCIDQVPDIQACATITYQLVQQVAEILESAVDVAAEQNFLETEVGLGKLIKALQAKLSKVQGGPPHANHIEHTASNTLSQQNGPACCYT